MRKALEDEGMDRWSIQGMDRTAQVLGRLGKNLTEPLLAKLWCDFGVDFAGGDEAKWNINTGFLFFAPTPVAESIATCVVD